MPRFSKTTVDKLKQSGWRHNRRTDISSVVKKAEEERCFLSRAMTDFLYEFQGLSLAYSNNEELFDFEPYLHSITKENCVLLSSLIGDPVFKVGVMSNSNLLVVISDRNKMYALTSGEHDIFLLGESFDEGIEFMCTYGLSQNRKVFEDRRLK